MISFDELLYQALYSPQGFYEQCDIDEHFITPSIASRSHAQLLSSWAGQQGLTNIVEYGAGSGALAQHWAPLCQSYQIVEKSHRCQQAQEQRLKEVPQVFHDLSLPQDTPVLVFLQEVFDCLEEVAVSFESQKAQEVQWDTEKSLFSKRTLPQSWQPALHHYQDFLAQYALDNCWKRGQMFFIPHHARALLAHIFTTIAPGSKVLIVDYGKEQPALSHSWSTHEPPLRAYKYHQLVPVPWGQWGQVDLTYDVDLYYLMYCWQQWGGQVAHYGALGQWLAQIIAHQGTQPEASCRILLEPRLMGECFKVVELHKP